MSARIVAAAVCPLTPLLFRHLSGIADPVADLREAAVTAVREATADADTVLVLAPVSGREAPGDWRDPSHSVPAHGEPVPLAVQVANHLLDLAGCALEVVYAEVPGAQEPTSLLDEDAGRVALLVMGDGAAARGQAAPAYVDDRSFGYDDAIAAALEAGDGAALAGLDAELGAALMASGRWTFPVLGALVPSAAGELRHRSDPFGLSYFVALWRPLS
jgi:hypothetical protein